MREKLETLSVTQLREIAKSQNIKYVMKLKKTELIEQILAAGMKMAKESELQGADKMKAKSVSKSDKENKSSVKTENGRTNGTNSKSDNTEPKSEFIIEENPEPEIKEEEPVAEGILEVMPDGYGFIRCENFLPGENDVYVSPSQIRRFRLKTGDILNGNMRQKNINEKFGAMTHLNKGQMKL